MYCTLNLAFLSFQFDLNSCKFFSLDGNSRVSYQLKRPDGGVLCRYELGLIDNWTKRYRESGADSKLQENRV